MSLSTALLLLFNLAAFLLPLAEAQEPAEICCADGWANVGGMCYKKLPGLLNVNRPRSNLRKKLRNLCKRDRAHVANFNGDADTTMLILDSQSLSERQKKFLWTDAVHVRKNIWKFKTADGFERARKIAHQPRGGNGKLDWTCLAYNTALDEHVPKRCTNRNPAVCTKEMDNSETCPIVWPLVISVRDGADAGSVSGATIAFTGSLSGMGSAVSDSDGQATLIVQEGETLNIDVTANGYFSNLGNVMVVDTSMLVNTYFLGPGLVGEETVRTVMTWGPNPRDTDIHAQISLAAPHNVSYCHSFFANRCSDPDGRPQAALDYDNTLGGLAGPETMTFMYVNPGSATLVYLRNLSGNTHSTLSQSGARLTVYTRFDIYIVDVPVGDSQNVIWAVGCIYLDDEAKERWVPINELLPYEPSTPELCNGLW